MQNLVTVFGGSGFVGTQVVRRLAKMGWRVRVAVRNPSLAHTMRLMGDVGQVDVVQANLRDAPSVARAVQGATAVVNLVGLLFETGRQKFQSVHVMGSKTVAEAAKAADVTRFVQMSALGADLSSASKYARTKAEGEQAVLAVYPDAVIVRPSIVFGTNDGFFNQLAKLASLSPVLPVFGGGEARFQPIAIGDLAEAIARLVTAKDAHGVYELGGPASFSLRQLYELVLQETQLRRILVPAPLAAASLMGAAFDFATWLGLSGILKPVITRDQVHLIKVENVPSGQYPGLADLGITPSTLESILPTYLYSYRKGGQYADQEDRLTASGRA
jgi:NADH dehydrogenase